MAESKAENKLVLDLTRDFLTAVKDRQDWHPFAQLRAQQMKAAPNIPTFTQFKVLRTRSPGRGRDPEVWRTVLIEITLGGNDQLRLQTVNGKLLAVKECDWDPCPVCDGTGETEDETVCQSCAGDGKIKVDPPRQPEKGSDTYEHDMKNGRFGICPASFEFIAGTQKQVA